MSFWRCFYHLVWTTKGRQPLLEPDLEAVVFRSIQVKSRQLDCYIHAMNSVLDHIHVAVTIHPGVAVMKYIQQIKGFSAFEANRIYPDRDTLFRWQGGYGALTLGEKALPMVITYVENQKVHHANDEIMFYLERSEDA